MNKTEVNDWLNAVDKLLVASGQPTVSSTIKMYTDRVPDGMKETFAAQVKEDIAKAMRDSTTQTVQQMQTVTSNKDLMDKLKTVGPKE